MFLFGEVDISIFDARNHTIKTPIIQKIICHTHKEGIPKDQLSIVCALPKKLLPKTRPGPTAKKIHTTVTIQALGLSFF